MKKTYWLFLFLLVASMAYAADDGIVVPGQNRTLDMKSRTTGIGSTLAQAGVICDVSQNLCVSVGADGGLVITQSSTPFVVQPGNTPNTTAWLMKLGDNGLSTNRFIADGAAKFANVTGAATVLYHARCYNLSTSTAMYVKIYNKATTPGTGDTPVSTDPIPQGATNQPGGVVVNIGADGVALGNGFGYGITTGLADNDNTAVANNAGICNFAYRVP